MVSLGVGVKAAEKPPGGTPGTTLRRLRAWLHRHKEARAAASSFRRGAPCSHTIDPNRYAMTMAGGKLHYLRPDGSTVCGFPQTQLVLVEEPMPKGMLCEWCEAST